MMQNYDEWVQNSYQESTIMSSMPDLSFSEALDIPDFSPGPKVSPSSDGGSGLYPKGSIGKPIRRRSRASKRAPTTLLTADPTNFRALVQQFTGCQSASPAFGAHKGPINLNFEQCSYHSGKRADQSQQDRHEESDQSLLSFRTNINAATTTKTDDHPPHLSTLDDDFDFENFSALLSETRDVDGF